MLRKDYDSFLRAASKEIKAPFYLQTAGLDGDFYCLFSRIRKDDTSALIKGQWSKNTNIHHGIFIDIFPLDAVPDSKLKRFVHEPIGKLLSVACNGSMFDLTLPSKNSREAVIKGIRKALRIIPMQQWYKAAHAWFSKYSEKNQRKVGLISLFYNQHKWIWNAEWFVNSTMVWFENRKISVPIDYERVLETTYGEWKKRIKGSSFHEGTIFDPDRSFKWYVERYDDYKEIDGTEL